MIAGAGIGGLALAALLDRRGAGSTVLERRQEPAVGGAGLALWPPAVAVLERVCEPGALRAGAAILRTANLVDWRGRSLATVRLPRGESPMLCTTRRHLASVLLRTPVAFGRGVEGWEEDEAGIRVRCADGSELGCDVLVGADGLHSTVRDGLHGPDRPIYRGRTSWRGLIDGGAWLPEGHQMEVLGPHQRFGLFPAGGDHWYWYLCRNGAELGEPDAPADALMDYLEGWMPLVREAVAATDASRIQRTDIRDRPVRLRWGSGRVTLLGDAAHPMTPDLGQGACQAILDASALDRALARWGTDGLRHYERRRGWRAATVQLASRQSGRIRQAGALVGAMRNLGLRLLPGWVARWGLRAFLAATA